MRCRRSIAENGAKQRLLVRIVGVADAERMVMLVNLLLHALKPLIHFGQEFIALERRLNSGNRLSGEASSVSHQRFWYSVPIKPSEASLWLSLTNS